MDGAFGTLRFAFMVIALTAGIVAAAFGAETLIDMIVPPQGSTVQADRTLVAAQLRRVGDAIAAGNVTLEWRATLGRAHKYTASTYPTVVADCHAVVNVIVEGDKVFVDQTSFALRTSTDGNCSPK